MINNIIDKKLFLIHSFNFIDNLVNFIDIVSLNCKNIIAGDF